MENCLTRKSPYKAFPLYSDRAALRQDEVAVLATERIKAGQRGIIARHSEKPLAIGLVQQAPSRYVALQARVRQSILMRSIVPLSGNQA